MAEIKVLNNDSPSNGMNKHSGIVLDRSSPNEGTEKSVNCPGINNNQNCRNTQNSDPISYSSGCDLSDKCESAPCSDSNSIKSNSEMHSFGWGKFRPKFLQGFSTAKWALFWFCWSGAIQGFIVNGFVNVVITTIEKRFGLRSTQTGLVASGYDIASFIFLIPVSYFGGRKASSKPKYLAWGVIVMGIGSLVFALPQFLIGTYSATLMEEGVCSLDDNIIELQNETRTSFMQQTISDEAEGDLTWSLWFFLGGQLLIGAGAAPLYTLGVAYIDENVSKKMSSVYLGIYYAMAIIGPALGYVVGGQFLLIYTDFMTVNPSDIGLTSESNIWIGAWWIGFLIGAIACFLLAIPLFGFPKTLPGIEKLQEEKNAEAHNNGREVQDKSYSTLKEMPKAVWALIRNPTLMSLNLAAASEGLAIAGFSSFLPKQIENQYSISPIFAAVLVGAVTVPAGGGGTFLGGYLVKRFKLKCAGIIKMCIFTTLIALALTSTFLLSCPNQSFAGVTVNYRQPGNDDNSNVVDFSLQANCNADCICSSLNYDPICGVDNIMYYNPCYAGCQETMTLDNKKVYSNCSCIRSGSIEQFQIEEKSIDASNTKCTSDCFHLPYFGGLIFLMMIFTFLATMPTLSATLRCVHDEQRSFALGVQWLKVRMIGTIPAPIIFGALIDQTCILWQDSFGGSKSGACLLFDNHGMSKYMWILALMAKLCSLIFYISAWWFYKPPPLTEEKPSKEADDNTAKTSVSNLDSK